MKNAFYFTLKSLYILRIFKFLWWLLVIAVIAVEITVIAVEIIAAIAVEITVIFRSQLLSRPSCYPVLALIKTAQVCISGGKKCSFFRKLGVLCFLKTLVWKLTLLPYYRRIRGKRIWKFFVWLCSLYFKRLTLKYPSTKKAFYYLEIIYWSNCN